MSAADPQGDHQGSREQSLGVVLALHQVAGDGKSQGAQGEQPGRAFAPRQTAGQGKESKARHGSREMAAVAHGERQDLVHERRLPGQRGRQRRQHVDDTHACHKHGQR